MKLAKNKADEFLKELSGLSRKHEILVTACSCCDGIHLESLNDPEWEFDLNGAYTSTLEEGEWIWVRWLE